MDFYITYTEHCLALGVLRKKGRGVACQSLLETEQIITKVSLGTRLKLNTRLVRLAILTPARTSPLV